MGIDGEVNILYKAPALRRRERAKKDEDGRRVRNWENVSYHRLMMGRGTRNRVFLGNVCFFGRKGGGTCSESKPVDDEGGLLRRKSSVEMTLAVFNRILDDQTFLQQSDARGYQKKNTNWWKKRACQVEASLALSS